MKITLTREQGFTLLEIVIYMTATAMLTVFMMTYMISIWSRFQYMENVRTVQYGAHTLMDQIVRDIRNSKSIEAMDDDELHLIRSDDTVVSYVWNSDPSVHSVEISDNGTTNTISNNIRVSDFSFGNGINSDVVTIDFTANQITNKAQVLPYSFSLSSKAVSRRSIY